MDLDCKLVYGQDYVIYDFSQNDFDCEGESYGAGGGVGDLDDGKAKCVSRSQLKGATPPIVTSFVIVGKCKYSYSNMRKNSPGSRSVSHVSSQITHKRLKKKRKA